jgi:4a-hydroxytetrahydrobiopterin dehydratase
MAAPLRERHCVPCRGDTPPLEPAARQRLLEELGATWVVVDGHHLRKEFHFRDFAAALAFVNRVGAVAEAEGHHPDVELTWGRATIKIWTHAIDGLTESDFVLAARIEAVAGQP